MLRGSCARVRNHQHLSANIGVLGALQPTDHMYGVWIMSVLLGGIERSWLGELNPTQIQDALTDASAELVLVEQPGARADDVTTRAWLPQAQGPLPVLPENVECNHSE